MSLNSAGVLLTGYLVLAAAGVALAWAGRRGRALSGRVAPIQALLRRPAARWLVLLLWWWVGWHFFVR